MYYNKKALILFISLGVLDVTFIVLVFLKASRVIFWPWWLVILPVWIQFLAVALFILTLCIFRIILSINDKKEAKKIKEKSHEST